MVWATLRSRTAKLSRSAAPSSGIVRAPASSATYVVSSPHAVRNAEMMRVVRDHVGRTVGLPAPGPIVAVGAWLVGSDPQLALTSRRARPARLLDEGFTFHVHDIATALGRPDTRS